MRRRTRAVALQLSLLVACASPAQAPDVSDGVPIADRQGQHVGLAEEDAVDRAARGGSPAPVYRDGEQVGHFGEEGFVPLDE